MDGERRFPIPTLGKSLKSERYHWPNPEKSTGEQYKNAKLGRRECWEAIGEVRQKFEEIASEIKTHLEKCSDPVAHPVVWTIYMIGRTRKESVPTIMFCGRDKNARIEATEMIKKSGIMDRHPGFRIGSRTEEFRHYARRKRRKRRKPTVQTCSGSPVEVMRAILHSPSDTKSETPILLDRPHITTCGHDQEFWNVTEGVKDRQETHIRTAAGASKAILYSPSDTRSATPILLDSPHITTCGHDQEFRNVTEGVKDRQETHIRTAAGPGKAILYSPSDTGPGMRILIQSFHGDSPSLRPATGGGFICHQGSIFLTTVAHAFHDDVVNAPPSSPENCDIEFELDDDSEEEEDDLGFSSRCSASFAPSESNDSTISGRTFSDTTSEFEQSATIVSATDHMINTSDANLFPARNPMVRAQTREPRLLVKSDDLLLPVGEHIILSTTGSRPGLDYCLIEIEANELLKSKQIPQKFDQSLRPVPSGVVMSEPRDVDVVAVAGSGGLLKGRLSGTPSFLMLPSSNLVQEVWTVRHGTEVFNGDCGAWVVDASNGNLFGHIVGGSPSLEVSYIIPAHFIFDDLKDRFDGEWKPAGVVPEPVVPDSLPAPVVPDPVPAPIVPDPLPAPVVPEPVPAPIVPDPLPAPGESKLRRSWYIKSMQSERVKVLVGASTFEVPHHLLVHCSTTFKRLAFLTTPNDPGREIALPDVTKSTFEGFLIWLYTYEQSLETENIDSAFHLAIFAQKYQIYDLRNQASDLIRAALHDRHWTITPDMLLAVYKVAPSDSSLRELCFLGFVSMEGHHRSLDWKAAFLECPSLGWDYFQYKSGSEMYHGQIETGGACRFHDHSNIDVWKPQDVIGCPYYFQTSLDPASGCGIESLATVSHKRGEASPALPSLHMDLPQYGRSISLRSPASGIDLSDEKTEISFG